MDAPQISILRDDSEPPSNQPSKRIKLAVSKSASASSSRPSPHKAVTAEEDEEDQLVDEEEPAPTPDASASSSPAKAAKITLKKRTNKTKSDAPAGEGDTPNTTSAAPIKAAPRKRASQKDSSLPSTPSKLSKAKSAKATGATLQVDQSDAQSDIYAPSAASSPPPGPNPYSPEPFAAPQVIVPNLEIDGPPPIYPLPTRPFPVQPAIKIASGYAVVPPLDKATKKLPVRKWRKAHREIRGIAGGRWLARTWAGEKDSPFSTRLEELGDDNQPASSTPLKFVNVEGASSKLAKPRNDTKVGVTAAKVTEESSSIVDTQNKPPELGVTERLGDIDSAQATDVDMNL